MPTRKVREVTAALKKKGFEQAEGDHSFFTYHRASDQKKTTVFTKVSHGQNEIDGFLIGKMAQQCRVAKAEFLSLVDCPLDCAGYEELLRSKGLDV
ncbi:MAG: type II toxin-antitoxin system HicA family toxin [Coriobacteriia bacterium]|nr:type II toxin-antitoxin system HicA family toxin [Coriobacteriia bacterium]